MVSHQITDLVNRAIQAAVSAEILFVCAKIDFIDFEVCHKAAGKNSPPTPFVTNQLAVGSGSLSAERSPSMQVLRASKKVEILAAVSKSSKIDAKSLKLKC